MKHIMYMVISDTCIVSQGIGRGVSVSLFSMLKVTGTVRYPLSLTTK